MILWLVQSTADHAELASGVAPPGLLSPREQARLAALRTPKRRHDWLLGRWTAKHLVQRYFEQVGGVPIALSHIEIDNDHDGVPHVITVPDPAADHVPDAALVPWSLSISHCEEYALCALVTATQDVLPWDAANVSVPDSIPDRPRSLSSHVGADIERIRPRANSFVSDYFTPGEIDLVNQVPAAVQDTMVTAIWSAKEAALKALHLGLTVDTRRVDCRLETTAAQAGTWLPLAVTFWPYPNSTSALDRRLLPGWWRTMGDYVLTIVVTED